MKKGDIITTTLGPSRYQIDEVYEDGTGLVAYPCGGGFEVHIYPREVLEVNPPWPPWEKRLIGFDEGPICWAYVRQGDRWNGWLRPRVPAQGVDALLAAIDPEGCQTKFWLDRDGNVRWSELPSGDLEDEGAPGTYGIVPTEIINGEQTWDFGGFGFCFIEHEEEVA